MKRARLNERRRRQKSLTRIVLAKKKDEGTEVLENTERGCCVCQTLQEIWQTFAKNDDDGGTGIEVVEAERRMKERMNKKKDVTSGSTES